MKTEDLLKGINSYLNNGGLFNPELMDQDAVRNMAIDSYNLLLESDKEINRLRKKCDMQANILRKLTPEKFPDTLFIHGTLGDKDQNNMPEKLLIVPAYGVDFSYIYERTEKTTGPEW
jgi:hypothetical protein